MYGGFALFLHPRLVAMNSCFALVKTRHHAIAKSVRRRGQGADLDPVHTGVVAEHVC